MPHSNVLVELLNSLPLGILLHFLWILTLLGIGLRWARADINTAGEILFWGVFLTVLATPVLLGLEVLLLDLTAPTPATTAHSAHSEHS